MGLKLICLQVRHFYVYVPKLLCVRLQLYPLKNNNTYGRIVFVFGFGLESAQDRVRLANS